MSFSSYQSVLAVCIIICINANDIKEPYFKQVTLECQDNAVNATKIDPSNIHTRQWIFPSGKTYDNDNNSPICRREKCWEMDASGFNVTIKRINDEDFGVYYCVIVMTDKSIYLIRKGLNVDGPYYGDLLAKYTENAKIGGIAAAVLFVLLGGSCFLWTCRYNKRKNIKSDSNGDFSDINMVHAYDNKATEMNEKL
ncbi:Hypothetical predicted protein [Mytilus galloprovincialis]|uniref:Ig-like domain-containing protein n=1 Tax=Mytilus galloprovincialis TaxID=29158 RepID=A0A8B6CXM1_MYTGA|nr:Hypothetical predicted protein [Mytilus galloprovincialis]